MYTELIHLCYGKYFLGVSCRKIFIATYKPQIYNKKNDNNTCSHHYPTR